MTITLAPAVDRGDSGPARIPARPSRTLTIIGIAVTTALFVIGGWRRRWIADDGLTVLRTVRNLLAGNGPVFNAGERVEVNTSTAWTYLIWFFGWLTQVRLEYVVLGLALILSALAMMFAMLGAARLWGGGSRLLLPAGAVVYIAVPPARDYATSGLESSLVICWLAVLWWWMIRWSQADEPSPATMFALSFLAGLAPLVRPELAVVGALALLMICCAPLPEIRLRPWASRALIGVAAGLVPLSYQIWRMGYYGLPYPNTAVAKDASGAKWRQGLDYLWNLIGPYGLWVPLAVLGAAAILAARAQRTAAGAAAKPTPRERVCRYRAWLRTPAAVVALLVGSGILLLAYQIRVGGDFMHGRTLLPPLFCLLLPVMMLPLGSAAARTEPRRVSSVLSAALAVTVGWGLWAADVTAIESESGITASGIADERLYYVRTTGRDHPIRAEDYLDYPRIRAMVGDIAASPEGGLLINTPSFRHWYVVPPPSPIRAAGHTVYYMNLGMISMNMPLHIRVIDPMGLAYPLAAHTNRFPDARIGHDKNLDADWAIVDAGMASRHPDLPGFIDEGWVSRIATALTCPETRDLLAATRAPLTIDRFLRNVHRSPHYAAYRIDRVPEHEIARCGLVDPAAHR
ncbi:flagellar motor control protein ZomB [Nocardia otitidiscaviarum]|uniref:flagellar motor control protein ZomB n=1 Tax=Nocardia otitidiscaviarum TaxID=1823 RepID=UPI002455978B|nr:flagellar motor control protein ZomB [Nocardia otitidiscaviarum]